MKFICFLLSFMIWATHGVAQSIIAARTVRANTIILPEDLSLSDRTIPGAFKNLDLVAGMETRVILYAGRPVLPGDVAKPALVDRNQIVPLVFSRRGLRIVTEARAMTRGALGESVRVMNLSSRTTVNGIVRADGSVEVGGILR